MTVSNVSGIVCDTVGCNNLASVNISLEHVKAGEGQNLCEECLKSYYQVISKHLKNKEKKVGKKD